MPKKPKSIGGKIGEIKSASEAGNIEKASSISEVGQITKTSSVAKVKGAGAANIGGKGRPLTAADREAMMQMISEEAEKLFGKSGMPEAQRKIAEEAVKLAIEGAIIEEEEQQD